MRQRRRMIAVMGGLALTWFLSTIVLAEDVPRMTREELKGMLGSPNLVIIDVRANVDWLGSHLQIRGAVREDPKKVNSWMDKYPKDKTLVFYCS
jgi:hypothetical protein